MIHEVALKSQKGNQKLITNIVIVNGFDVFDHQVFQIVQFNIDI
jgi:hypothetical protein